MEKTFHRDAVVPSNAFVYVFGSCMSGKLTTPRQKIARNNFRVAYGTTEGESEKGYAIPVRGIKGDLIQLDELEAAVDRFIAFACSRPKLAFFVTRVGCDAGEYSDKQIGELFRKAPGNCSLPEEWEAHVSSEETEAA